MPQSPLQDLRRRAGLLVMRGFRGCSVDGDDAVVTDLRECGLGSVVLFDTDGPTARLIMACASTAAVTASAAVEASPNGYSPTG